MRILGGAVAVVAALGVSAGPARADDPTPSSLPPPPVLVQSPVGTTDVLSHAGQFGITTRVATGLRFISTYQPTTPCNSSGGQACLGRLPTELQVELSFGLDRHIELLGEFTVGLEQDFSSISSIDNGPHVIQLSPGLRFFYGLERHVKLFSTVQAVFDFSDYRDTNNKSLGNDFGLRNVNAYVYDFNRTVGAYIFAGETVTFERWLDFELEAGLGVQLRYP